MGRGVHAPESKGWRLFTLGCLIVVVPSILALIVAAVTWLVGVVTVTTKTNALPKSVQDYKATCAAQRTVYTRAPAYEGAGPHPVVIFQGEQVAATQVLMAGGSQQLSSAWTTNDPAQVQLIVCAERRDYGTKVKDCHFDRPVADVPMYTGGYDVTVVEARTGRTIGDLKIEGKVAECPTVKHFDGQEERRLFSTPSGEQYFGALRKFVEG